MKYKVNHVRFGESVDLNGTMVNSWDESRKRAPEDECIYDTDLMIYFIKVRVKGNDKGRVVGVHATNVSQFEWAGKIDNMAKARAAKAAKAA